MLENEDGTDFLPMRLATVLIVSALIMVAAASIAGDGTGQMSKMAARKCASKIAAVAATEYVESCPGKGEGASVDVSVPETVDAITFELQSPEGSGAYSIQYVDGSCEVYLHGVPAVSGGPVRGGPFILKPGNYRILIVTEEIDGSVMVLLHREEI